MKALLWEKSGSALLSLRKLYTGTSKIENWKHFDTKSKLMYTNILQNPYLPTT
jgi:hypothetical protein